MKATSPGVKETLGSLSDLGWHGREAWAELGVNHPLLNGGCHHYVGTWKIVS